MNQKQNPLGIVPVKNLLVKFAVPAVIAMVVGSLYNMVDQVFIGWGIGTLGNAATSVMFPIPTISISMALLAGIGGAANYNLRMGRGEEKEALRFAGNSLSLDVIIGVIFMAVILICLKPLLFAFGATDQIMPYAVPYTRIIAIGLPFYILGTGGTHMIRADGRPGFSMLCGIIGAVINTVLDPIFIFGFHWGMQGAAWATVIGQIVSAILIFAYFAKMSNMKLTREAITPHRDMIGPIFALGVGGTIFNLALAAAQIIMNNMIRFVGPTSACSVETALAVVGVITKVDQIFRSIGIGIHQGCQPIFGFNYGAKLYGRVRETYLRAAAACVIVGACFFAAYMLIPHGILAIFGGGSEEYFAFGTRFLHIYLMFTVLNAIPLLTSGFFTGIGKAKMASVIPVIKHIITFIPLLLILPRILGIDGVLYAGAISDAVIIVFSLVVAFREVTWLKQHA